MTKTDLSKPMKKLIALLAVALTPVPAMAGFVIPEPPKPADTYNSTALEWRGCLIPKDGYTVTRDIKHLCDRHFFFAQTEATVQWKDAKKCETYTDGCVELSLRIKGFTGAYYISDAKRLNRTVWVGPFSVGTVPYSELEYSQDGSRSLTDYDQVQFNCLEARSRIVITDGNGKRASIFDTDAFHKHVCNTVFEAKTKSTGLQLQEVGCALERDVEKREMCTAKNEHRTEQERWR